MKYFIFSPRLQLFMLLGVLFAPLDALAGNTGNEFNSFYTYLLGLARGFLGKAIAIAAMIIGALLSLAKGNPMPVLVGIGFAIFLQYGPTVVTGVLTATI